MDSGIHPENLDLSSNQTLKQLRQNKLSITKKQSHLKRSKQERNLCGKELVLNLFN
jgi:hypothetical protein